MSQPSQPSQQNNELSDDDYNAELPLSILSQGELLSQTEPDDCPIRSTQSSDELNSDLLLRNCTQISFDSLDQISRASHSESNRASYPTSSQDFRQISQRSTQTIYPSQFSFLSSSSQSQSTQNSTSSTSQETQTETQKSSQNVVGLLKGRFLNAQSSDDLIKNTIKSRLEILCKVLHGKGKQIFLIMKYHFYVINERASINNLMFLKVCSLRRKSWLPKSVGRTLSSEEPFHWIQNVLVK